MDRQPTKGQKTFVNKTRKKFTRTIYQHKLIDDNDCILIGLSGGKDSLALLDLLANRRKALPFTYRLKAVHINVTNIPYEVDTEFLQNICKQLDVEFLLHEITVDLKTNPQLSTCFRCSWARRTALFRLVEKLGCNKLAFGHHMDDANETLLMNMLFNGEISSLPYKVEMFEGKFDLIRPMLDLEGQDVAYYANILGLKAETKRCPHEKINRRAMIRNTLEQFYKIHPGIKRNLFRSPRKIIYKYLPLPPDKQKPVEEPDNNEQHTLCDAEDKISRRKTHATTPGSAGKNSNEK